MTSRLEMAVRRAHEGILRCASLFVPHRDARIGWRSGKASCGTCYESARAKSAFIPGQ